MPPKFEGKPLLPYGWDLWPSKNEAAAISWVQDDGRKAIRLRVPKGEPVRLFQRYVEVAPGATYSFGLSAKGSGRVDLIVWVVQRRPMKHWRRPGSTQGRSGRRSRCGRKWTPIVIWQGSGL